MCNFIFIGGNFAAILLNPLAVSIDQNLLLLDELLVCRDVMV